MYNATGQCLDETKMLQQHGMLVKKIAYQMKAKLPASVEVDDLIQAGMMGLLDAVKKFQDNLGAQFETYAVQRIRGSIIDELRSADWLPRSVRKDMRTVESAVTQLEQKLQRPPTEGEVAKHMELSIDDYRELLGDCSGHQLLYYDDFQETENDGHFLDRYMNDVASNPLQVLLSSNFKESLVVAIGDLPEREKLLMALYYEQELNLKEIGAIMGVSESRVCQLHTQAVARLRVTMKEKAWTGAV
ncbi:MAG: RNA polymerase sigma factor FliA [Methylophilaceae bacterium]|nr:RNA polymerase sigma factor FliA [Methylophilaceae bacterium]